jgi:hypothetical protein
MVAVGMRVPSGMIIRPVITSTSSGTSQSSTAAIGSSKVFTIREMVGWLTSNTTPVTSDCNRAGMDLNGTCAG